MRRIDLAIYRVGALWLLLLVLLATGASAAHTPKLRDLDRALEPLKSDFAKDADKVRLVLLVSPTCTVCRANASTVRRALAEFPEAQDIAVYAVWFPMRGDDERRWVEDASRLLPGSSTRHYWADRRDIGRAFGGVLGFDGNLAWDVYSWHSNLLLYGPGQHEGAWPPKPDVLLHQHGYAPRRSVGKRITPQWVAESIRRLRQQEEGAAP